MRSMGALELLEEACQTQRWLLLSWDTGGMVSSHVPSLDKPLFIQAPALL